MLTRYASSLLLLLLFHPIEVKLKLWLTNTIIIGASFLFPVLLFLFVLLLRSLWFEHLFQHCCTILTKTIFHQ